MKPRIESFYDSYYDTGLWKLTFMRLWPNGRASKYACFFDHWHDAVSDLKRRYLFSQVQKPYPA